MATYLPPLNFNDIFDARTFNYQDDQVTMCLSQCPPLQDGVTSWRMQSDLFEPRQIELKQFPNTHQQEIITLRTVFTKYNK